MTFFASALVMGFFASGHCLGMCGPLVLALPPGDGNFSKAVFFRVLYNLGRIATYAMLGALAGLAGAALAFEGAQAKVASIAGVLLIIVALMQVLPKLRLNLFSHVYQVISRFISPRLKNAGAGRFVLLGLLNGFLPCGMVAAALVVSIAAETVAEGVLYMAVYGLGTLPMMLTASLMGFYLAARTKRILTIVGPVYSLAVGVLLLVRPALIAPHCG